MFSQGTHHSKYNYETGIVSEAHSWQLHMHIVNSQSKADPSSSCTSYPCPCYTFPSFGFQSTGNTACQLRRRLLFVLCFFLLFPRAGISGDEMKACYCIHVYTSHAMQCDCCKDSLRVGKRRIMTSIASSVTLLWCFENCCRNGLFHSSCNIQAKS